MSTKPGGRLTVFSCGRPRGAGPELPPCSACKGARRTDLACAFQLRGARAGEACRKPLCAKCAKVVGVVRCCPAHARLLVMQAENVEKVGRATSEGLALNDKIRAAYDAEIARKAALSPPLLAMPCANAELFFDGELGATAAGAFRDHLPGCRRCDEKIAGLAQEQVAIGHGYPGATPPRPK